MESESMVHALEQVHRLIVAGGALIDIHPNGEKVQFLRPMHGRLELIGHLEESDDYIEYRQADEAIQVAVARRLFAVEDRREFEFHVHADSFDELKTFLEEHWSDAVITDEVVSRAKALEKQHGRYKTVLREQVKLGVLRRL